MAGFIASTKKGSVLEQVKLIERYGKYPICQTSIAKHNKLERHGNPNGAECEAFIKRYKAKHKIDLDTKTLHTSICPKSGLNTVQARIINTETTGLKLCKCCK